MPLTRFVALLRGVNVGGKNKLPMSALASLFAAAGFTNVQTFIQSGNVVFSADSTTVHQIIETVEAGIERDFGFRPPIVIRSAHELTATLAANTFWSAQVDEDLLYVMFLRDLPDPARVALLEPGRSAPDSFVVHGRDIFLCLENGAARTKLTNAYFDSKLATISTSRNWRTVNSLVDLLNKS